MKQFIFPEYSVEHLVNAIDISANNKKVSIESLGLESIRFNTSELMKKNNAVSIELSLFTKSFDLEGEITDSQFDRKNKTHSYQISLKFKGKVQFLKWMAILKGIHKSRFNC